jgi:CRISPR/Cas system-associated exonuclease Cas4 (RecB family)
MVRSFQPAPGRPIQRDGLPYVYVTWLAKLLGGHSCLWSAWFKAHFKYEKFETMGEQLAEWNRDHSAMMRGRVQELEENGWTVTTEDQNAFKLKGKDAIVAGKPDIVATMPGLDGKPGHMLVVDGKTGREREADYWQVLIYLFALPFSRPDLTDAHTLEGEVHYKVGDKRVPVPMAALSDERRDDIVRMVKTIAASTPPRRAPSRHECQRCNIGFADCPERFREPDETVETPSSAVGF